MVPATRLTTEENTMLTQPNNSNTFYTEDTTGPFAAPRPVRSMIDLPGIAWQAAAEELTAWAVEHLVVHRDQFGSQEASVFVRRHFRRDWTSDVSVWLHPVSRHETAKWFLITINHQCDDAKQRAAINWQAASGWHEELQRRGFKPLLLDSDAGTDLQLLVLLQRELPALQVFRFVRQFVSDYQARGLSEAPEVMPNQADIDAYWRGAKRWRLVGMHDDYRHFTRLWNGKRWLEREEAIEAILSVAGDPVELVLGYQPC